MANVLALYVSIHLKFMFPYTMPGRAAQSVARVTQEPEVPGSLVVLGLTAL